MGIVEGGTTKAFRSCENKGFHLTFKNGWTVSIQFGAGNYSDNYNLVWGKTVSYLELYKHKPDLESDTAEVWAWCGNKHEPENPLGYLTIDEVFEFIDKIRRKRMVKK